MSGKVIMERSEYDELHRLAHESDAEIKRLAIELSEIKEEKKIVIRLENSNTFSFCPSTAVSATEKDVIGWINKTIISINNLQDQINILTEQLAKKDKIVDKYKQIKELFMDND